MALFLYFFKEETMPILALVVVAMALCVMLFSLFLMAIVGIAKFGKKFAIFSQAVMKCKTQF